MTRKTTLSFASVLALILAAGVAQAQDAAPKADDGPRGFSAMDFNGDGKITLEDFTARKLERQKALDADGDGFITLEEMKAHAGAEARQRAEEHAERRFKALDTNGDGRISAAEALTGERGFRGHRGVEHFIERADTDKDGAVSPEEFEAARKAMREHGPKGHPGKPHGGHGPKGDHGPKGEHGPKGPRGGPEPEAPRD